MGLLVFMSRKHLGMILRPDLGRLRDVVTGKLKDSYTKRTPNWQGNASEDPKTVHALNNLSPWFIVLYCLTYTIWAFDLIMSLDPHWISNLFGA
jgi:hypothetical protein